MKRLLLLGGLFFSQGYAVSVPENIFSYDLGVKVIPSETQTDQVTICCHGYGHCNEIVDVMASHNVLPGHLIGFNFPDYGIRGDSDHSASAFGSIDELLPLVYLIKQYACDQDFAKINLYGFSAGGGAVINALAVLHQGAYADELKNIGITQNDIATMMRALEQGDIILECPLKSVAEILVFRGRSRELEILDARYTKNNMNPIDVLPQLTGVSLNIFVYFEKPDDVVSNRDDGLFVERLRKANSGATHVISGSGGAHNTHHERLWSSYKK